MKLFKSRSVIQFLIVLLSVFGPFFLLPGLVNAENDYKTDYIAEYELNKSGDSKVKLSIKVTNLRSDIHVSEFALTFPSSFEIRSLAAYDDAGVVAVKREKDDQIQKLTLIFNQPSTGKGSINNLRLEFVQRKLFTVAGNIWEVMLPVIDDSRATNYAIIVTVPDERGKNVVSIAKPTPSRILGNKIIWDNVDTQTVYAVFGESQFFSYNLNYAIKNDRFVARDFDIAIPPETLYQKVYIDEILPIPDKAYLDEDGNYLLRFSVAGNETKKVLVKGFAQVFSKPQKNLMQTIRNISSEQKSYLLSESRFWKLGENTQRQDLKTLKTPLDIYNYVTSNLNYDFSRVKKTVDRLGAEAILKSPNKAICMEFTDLFVSLARQKGIMAREIQGYGFSQDTRLRPLSLVSDVLHSWPEYFDEEKKLWIPVDPTWANTSGIDYFNSFDLNHIVFAIHGRDSVYPLPAGMYKVDGSKDVSIDVVSQLPQDNISVEINEDFRQKIISGNKYMATIDIANNGNVFIKNAEVKLESQHVSFDPKSITIDILAPFQTNGYKITYAAPASEQSDTIKILFNSETKLSKKISITSRSKQVFTYSAAYGLAFILILSIVILVNKKK